jgi:hypothetical protein
MQGVPSYCLVIDPEQVHGSSWSGNVFKNSEKVHNFLSASGEPLFVRTLPFERILFVL